MVPVCYTESNQLESANGKKMSMVKLDLPHYRGSIYLDGYTYRISLRFQEGPQETSVELPHSHPQYELHAVFQGEVILEQEGSSPAKLQSGNCCLISPLTYHLRKIGSDTTKCCSLYIDTPKGAPLHMENHGRVDLVCAPVLIQYLSLMERELADRQIGADNSIQCLLTLLLVTMIRELNNLESKAVSKRCTPAFQQREETIDNYFASRYGQEISAQDLAVHLGITTRQLARIMQQRYGCTFRTHLLDIRLYHARQLLTNSEATILQIANACGFSCQGAFATVFRKEVGCTPSQYRQQHKR